jgi:hypothetical protein
LYMMDDKLEHRSYSRGGAGPREHTCGIVHDAEGKPQRLDTSMRLLEHVEHFRSKNVYTSFDGAVPANLDIEQHLSCLTVVPR